MNFGIPLISKTLEKYLLEFFYYYFIETYLLYTGGMCVDFFAMLMLKCCTKLNRLKVLKQCCSVLLGTQKSLLANFQFFQAL